MLDLLVTGALVVDGSGGNAFPGAVGISGGRIAGVWRGGATQPEAIRTIAAEGKVVAPGFVDVHNHSDLSALILPTFDSYIRQGVTTVVVGNCGLSPWPAGGFRDGIALAYGDPDAFELPRWPSYGDYLGALDEGRPAVNIATLVGHGTVRQEVLGLGAGPPSDDQLERMRSLVRDAMGAGAYGVSTGLDLRPRDLR